MKRHLILLALLLLLPLTGCNSENDSGLSASDLQKAQAIAVIASNGSIRQTITEQGAIDDFVDVLDIDHWELADLPADASIIGQFGLSQEKTIHFGEQSNDGKLYDVATITLYDTPNLRINLLSFNFDFAIPDSAHEKLAEYLAQ